MAAQASVLRFFVRSRSPSGSMILQHLEKKGLLPVLEHSREFRLLVDCLGQEDEDMVGEGELEEVGESKVMQAALLQTISFFWLRRRKFFPFELQERYMREGYRRIDLGKMLQLRRKINSGEVIQENLSESELFKMLELCSSNEKGPPICVNHLREEWRLTNKEYLRQSLVEFYGNAAFQYHPETFLLKRLEEPAKAGRSVFDTTELEKRGQQRLWGVPPGEENANPPLKWIVKPSSAACGRGVQVHAGSSFSSLYAILDASQERKAMIFQRYIYNPVLYKGRKFDIRVYCLVLPHAPFVAFYHSGYLRMAAAAYDSKDLTNRFSHITNFSIQKRHPEYDAKRGQVAGFPVRVDLYEFYAYLEKNPPSKAFLDSFFQDETLLRRVRESRAKDASPKMRLGELVEARIKEAMRWSVTSVKGIWEKVSPPGQFALLGVDFLIDDTGDCWLLEYTKSPVFRDASMLQETVDIALELETLRSRGQWDGDVRKLSTVKTFQKIITPM